MMVAEEKVAEDAADFVAEDPSADFVAEEPDAL